MVIDSFLEKYKLKRESISDIALRECFMQSRPNCPLDDLFENSGCSNHLVLESPHFRVASLFFSHGELWLKKHYKKTKYYKLCKDYLNKDPKKAFAKVVNLCVSLKNGYLNKKHREDYIVVLLEPFAISRYNRRIEFLVPEIFSGHHRAAILLALGKDKVKVVVAKDTKKGFCKCYGKIHQLCVDKGDRCIKKS